MPPTRTSGPRRARGLVRLAVGAALALVVLSVGAAVGATPGPEPSLLVPGDPRSEGEGPGLIGSPVAVAVGVVVLGLLAAGGTIVILRLTRDD